MESKFERGRHGPSTRSSLESLCQGWCVTPNRNGEMLRYMDEKKAVLRTGLESFFIATNRAAANRENKKKMGSINR